MSTEGSREEIGIFRMMNGGAIIGFSLAVYGGNSLRFPRFMDHLEGRWVFTALTGNPVDAYFHSGIAMSYVVTNETILEAYRRDTFLDKKALAPEEGGKEDGR